MPNPPPPILKNWGGEEKAWGGGFPPPPPPPPPLLDDHTYNIKPRCVLISIYLFETNRGNKRFIKK